MTDEFSDSLYYECHITIEPVIGDRLNEFKCVCSDFGFRVAKLIMEKGPSRKDSFCTGRSKNLTDITKRMYDLLQQLTDRKFDIFRYKIENCILDVHL